jgi:hypothetical protein
MIANIRSIIVCIISIPGLTDANGSMTKNDDKTIQWTSFNKPKSFTKGKDSTTFTYGPDCWRVFYASVWFDWRTLGLVLNI